MKRIIAFLVSALLLCGIAFAEDAYVPCQHEYHMWLSFPGWISSAIEHLFPDEIEAFCGYARCERCHDDAYLLKDPGMVKPEACEPDECIHRLYVQPDLSYHDVNLEQYEVAVCVDCNEVFHLLNRMGVLYKQVEHQMVERGFHIDGQYIHVIFEECQICGKTNGELVPCISYEDGSCDRTR